MSSNALTNRQKEKIYEVFIDAFSGASGGVLASLLLYPLENFRTRLQASTDHQKKKEEGKSEKSAEQGKPEETKTDVTKDQKNQLSTSDTKSESTKSTDSVLFKGNIFSILTQMIKRDGIKSFYKGL